MAISLLAGKPAPKEMLVDPAKLEGEYYARTPDMGDPNQSVAFGTSGHRGSSFRGSFNEAHILAVTQAICDYRRGQGTDGPLYMGKDTLNGGVGNDTYQRSTGAMGGIRSRRTTVPLATVTPFSMEPRSIRWISCSAAR
jgi:hypothetical protein